MIERNYPHIRDAFELTFREFDARLRALASREDLDRDNLDSRMAGEKLYTGLLI